MPGSAHSTATRVLSGGRPSSGVEPRWTLLALLALLAIALAGCTGDGGAPPADEPGFEEIGLEATSTTGILRGVVVDDAIRPVADAQVELRGTGRSAQTTVDGLFGFDGLDAGTYFVDVSKVGHVGVQQSADVVAGVADPPIVRVLLTIDATYQPYVQVLTYEGYIECTTSVLVLCGAPNTLEPIMCGGIHEPPLPPTPPVCYGNLTNDRFTWTFSYQPNLTWMQVEMVWESTQALSPELTLEMETLDAACGDDDYYFNEGSASPLVWSADGETIAGTEVDFAAGCPVYYSVFAGSAADAPAPVGVTAQQRFTAYSFAFYSYTPPEGWSFTGTGEIPQPPG